MFEKKYIFGLVVLILLGFGILLLSTAIPSSEKKDIATTQQLSAEKYAAARKEFLELVQVHDQRHALETLHRRIQTDTALLRSCHALVHEIGHAAYKKYGDFAEALTYQNETCNSGYLHGVIEAHFSKTPDVFAEMQTICDVYPAGKYVSWECFHGVGHGVMYYTANDLPRSLTLCDTYRDELAQEACANGVFMENFNADQKLHISKFLKPDDPSYPCSVQANRHKSDCYLYAPAYYLSLHPDDYASALVWCETIEPLYASSCVQGVGGQAMKEHINDPLFVENVCTGNKPSQTPACIAGMIGLYINHFGSLEPARDLCERLTPSNKMSCLSVIRSSTSLFD